MLSEAQEEKRREKILKVIRYILENRNATIPQIAEAVGISPSSVQRYLHDNIIDELTNLDVDKPRDIIQGILKNNKEQGLIKGGNTYAQNNAPLKNEQGRFTGSHKK